MSAVGILSFVLLAALLSYSIGSRAMFIRYAKRTVANEFKAILTAEMIVKQAYDDCSYE